MNVGIILYFAYIYTNYIETVFRCQEKLLKLLAFIADVNDNRIKEVVDDSAILADIRDDVARFSQDKEVQAMLLAEQFQEADLRSAKSEAIRKGHEEGFNEGHEEGFNEGHEEGFNEGLKEGFDKGGRSILFDLVRSGDLDVSVAAKRLGMDNDVFLSEMQKSDSDPEKR